MKKSSRIGLLLLASFVLVFSSCNKDENDDIINPAGIAKLDINLAATYNLKSVNTYDAVNLEILQISFHTSGDTNVAGGWYDLETIPGIYNLLDYIVDDTLIAFDSLVGTQTISQIRLLLGDNNTVVEDGETYDLSTPSAQTSGLKVQLHLQMLPESAYVIMLDFDPEESIKKIGNGQYKLKPVIRTIVNP